ncbi:adenosylhomocysteinase [Leucobacter chromiiresistens]|uniref:Adenosylhomocysteinase n=2 Tax=Leucobacter chromiiresistens TaxID=1079994 RepID=A0A1H1ACI5_9MICO|nr:adenosylhomocysteinase [Leucobacter chromiiresistens]SDQ37448.1 adenosylhomocysteinase [Leucobacter chromiiresistens]
MTDSTECEAGAARGLAVERAIRAAARAGNRLISGATVSVDLERPEMRDHLAEALRRMGARLRPAGEAVDFAFVDRAIPDGRSVDGALHECAAADRSPAGGLPGIVVGLDGGVRPLRGASAASRIAWAAAGMPATAELAGRLGAASAHRGVRVGVSLVLEPKTAAFARLLADAGCSVAVFSAVSETDAEIAEELARDERIAVFAPRAADPARPAADVDAAHAAAILDWAPEYLIDDGAHLIRLAHSERSAALARLRGAAEETTSGVRPVREMAALDALRLPVIAVNDARTKTDFDNLIGTGQSCVFAIADVLDAASDARPYAGVAGTRWAVIGYGPVGRGVARFAAALGAEVVVVERDPVRALAALHDGHEAEASPTGLSRADVVVSATGVWHTLDARAVSSLQDGAVVAVAGGIDDEIALDELREEGWEDRGVARGVAEWRAPAQRGGRAVLVLADGGGVNYTAAEGNPIEVMDLSFATQLAALAQLTESEPRAGVHRLSEADERRVAAAALAARGGAVDPSPDSPRAGGAAQPWTVHRYRSARGERPEGDGAPTL